MQHRWPDASEFLTLSSWVSVWFHRLAIQDTTQNWMQPFCVQHWDQQVTRVCNGEIYNYQEIKKEFPHVQRQSTSDCEILGHSYIRYGWDGMISRLDGEFAIVLISEIPGSDTIVYASRDRYGVRPLYLSTTTTWWTLASELKWLMRSSDWLQQIRPGQTCRISVSTTWYDVQQYGQLGFEYQNVYTQSLKIIKQNIVSKFEAAVQRRLVADRPLACLLSGGLDSSLVCAVAQKYTTEPLHTYTIGLDWWTDLQNARLVADYIWSIHHEILMTNQEALDVVKNVIYAIESWDTTTVRASTFQYLIGRHIAAHSDHRVILTWEWSDELTWWYLYFQDAPSGAEFDDECRRLLRDIYLTDGLRVDRAMAAHGLEVRIPFLDHDFVDYYLSLPCELRQAKGTCEKYLLRSAFEQTRYLPDEILWRKKEAFSDGVSTIERSRYQILQEAIEQEISDEQLRQYQKDSDPTTPQTKEQVYFRKIFVSHFGLEAVRSIPYYRMPKRQKWITDPSARALWAYNL